jgi:peptidoglycan-associated lipoprotein
MRLPYRSLAPLAAVVAFTVACPPPAPPPAPPAPAVNQDSIDAAARARAEAERQRLAAEEAARREAADRAAREEAARLAREAEERTRAAMAAARSAFATAIYFELDRSELTAEARAVLEAKLPLLRANPNVRIRIAGHADDRGSDDYNVALSQRRAAAARRFLVEQGIAQDRVDVVGFGEERPAMTGNTEDAWARNRRAEFEIIVGGESLRLP